MHLMTCWLTCKKKSEFLKDKSAISKQIVQVILDAVDVLEFVGENDKAHEFMFLLGLVVRNEAPNDRQPGVPRII